MTGFGLFLVSASPQLLLNTNTGRRVLVGAANSGDEGHLGLGNAQLNYFPSVSLVLEDLRLTQPFEPLAPRMAMKRLQLNDLSLESSLPGTPLICKVARLEGISLEVHQSWVQQKQKDARPPSLPEPFPSLLLTDLVELKDVDYRVHQTRHGRPVELSLQGINASLKDFRWDFKAMQVEGSGPLSAERLNLNGMQFTELHVPDFQASSERIVLPRGTLSGLGGQVTFSGALVLVSGLPIPDFQIQGTSLNLTQIIESAPDPAPPGPRPDGQLSIRAHVTADPNSKPGEVAEPIMDGDVVMENFRVPLVKQSAAAMKILAHMPGYIAATADAPARLDLGTFRSHVHIANGSVTLKDGQMSLGGVRLAMAGSIEQGSGALDLKLWLDRSGDKGEASDAEKKPHGLLANLLQKKENASNTPASEASTAAMPTEDSAKGDPAARPDGTASAPGLATRKSDPAASSSTPSERGSEEPGAPLSFKEKLLAKKAEVDSKVLAKKAEVDSKVLEVKADVDSHLLAARDKAAAELAAAKASVDTRISETREAIQGGPQAMKAQLDARAAELKSRVDEKFAAVKAAIDADLSQRKDALLDLLEEKLGRPTLCITGTTAHPVINPCQEPAPE